MKKFSILWLTLCSVAIFSISSYAQISITASDVSNFYKIGSTWSVSGDSIQGMYNIGAPGGGNTWDFSSLPTGVLAQYDVIDPAGSPFADRFGEATVAVKFTFDQSDVSGETYIFYKLNNKSLTNYGLASSSTFDGTTGSTIATYSPEQPNYNFPVEVGTSWTYEGNLTNQIFFGDNSFPATISSVTDTTVVDAYGTLIFPDGTQAEALRLKQISYFNTEIVPGFPNITRSVNFTFITKGGSSVSVSAINETAPDQGVIEGSLSWVQGGTITSTVDLAQKGYRLEAVYPNPVKANALIQYSLPESKDLEINLIDVQGKQVRSLFKGTQASGAHQLDFFKENLAAGIYFIQLRVAEGGLTQSILIGN